jgi:carboxymethylenebutenolidase
LPTTRPSNATGLSAAGLASGIEERFETDQQAIHCFEGVAMTEVQKNQQTKDTQPGDIARRDFVALSVAAGLAGSAAAAGLAVVETNVEVKTPDGTCDAAFIHPKTGSHPGVLIWPDAFGLRPSMREMAKRIAAEGYSVLVPNPFYRVAKAPFSDASTFSFQNPDDMAKLRPLMASVNAPGNAEKDAVAYVAFLDAQEEVNKAKKIGTQGYCMGGPLVVKTAAVLPDRIGAGASFHGGGLVTDKPDSPHLGRAEDQGPYVFRRGVERRRASAGCQGQAEGSLRGCQGSCRNRSVLGSPAWLVCTGHAYAKRRADLQQARR